MDYKSTSHRYPYLWNCSWKNYLYWSYLLIEHFKFSELIIFICTHSFNSSWTNYISMSFLVDTSSLLLHTSKEYKHFFYAWPTIALSFLCNLNDRSSPLRVLFFLPQITRLHVIYLQQIGNMFFSIASPKLVPTFNGNRHCRSSPLSPGELSSQLPRFRIWTWENPSICLHITPLN